MKATKIRITETTRKCFTIYEGAILTKMQEATKDDAAEITNYCKSVLQTISGFPSGWELYRVTAEITKNNRVFDIYFDGSEQADIWIECLGFNSTKGAAEIGFYLSDAWQIGNEEGNNNIKRNCYKNTFFKQI